MKNLIFLLSLVLLHFSESLAAEVPQILEKKPGRFEMLNLTPEPSKDFEALFAKLQPRLEELWKKDSRMISGDLIVTVVEISGRNPKITDFHITITILTRFAEGVRLRMASLAVLRKPDSAKFDVDGTTDKIVARAAEFFSKIKNGTQASIVPRPKSRAELSARASFVFRQLSATLKIC